MYANKRILLILLLGILVFSSSACADASASTSAPGLLEPPPVPSPAQKEAEILQGIRNLDILEYLPEDTYIRVENQKWYDPIIENEALTLSLPQKYMNWLEDAIAQTNVEGIVLESGELDAPDWPMLAAILMNYQNDVPGLRHALNEAGGISCSISKSDDGKVVGTISAKPLDAATLCTSLPKSDKTNPLSLLLSYAYLSTVFDESPHGKDGISDPDLDALIFPV